ncbi:MAG: hypothetical protein ACIARR_06135 [Phycisphaerales bacterium JB059]
MTQKTIIGLLALATGAGGALAQNLTVHDGSALTPIGARAGGPRSADGDLYGTTISVFSGVSGFHLDSLPDVHIFGGSAFMGTSTLEPSRAFNITTSENDLGGGLVEYVFVWATDDQGAFLPSGNPELGGAFYDTIGFEVGEGNAPAELVEWSPNPGFSVVETSFQAYNTSGVDMLGGTGEFFVSENGGAGLSGGAFITSVSDIRELDLSMARATITIQKVPTPGALSVLGASGLLATRRRRR